MYAPGDQCKTLETSAGPWIPLQAFGGRCRPLEISAGPWSGGHCVPLMVMDRVRKVTLFSIFLNLELLFCEMFNC